VTTEAKSEICLSGWYDRRAWSAAWVRRRRI